MNQKPVVEDRPLSPEEVIREHWKFNPLSYIAGLLKESPVTVQGQVKRMNRKGALAILERKARRTPKAVTSWQRHQINVLRYHVGAD
jgi:ABC-type uncharacterized transport system YnjBCD ATPase subunit